MKGKSMSFRGTQQMTKIISRSRRENDVMQLTRKLLHFQGEVRIMPRARCRRKNVAIGQHTRALSPSPIATKMHVDVVSFLFLLYCANRSMSMLFLLSRWTLRRWHGFQIDVMRPCSQTLPLVRIK